MFEVQPVRAVIRGWIQQRVGAFGEHRHPTGEVIVGNLLRITENRAVVMNDRCTGGQCLKGVGRELFMRSRNVRIVFLRAVAIDRSFDDDWSPVHGREQ